MTPPTPYSQTDQMQAVSYALGKCSELIPFSRCPCGNLTALLTIKSFFEVVESRLTS
jgi:hypothetical protein